MRRRFFTELNTNKYFNIEILGDGDISFRCNSTDIDYYNLLKYSKNNIKNWKSIQVETFPAELSDIIYFKCKKWNVRTAVLHVETPCKINGNPLSLCGYTPDTDTNFDSFLSNINVIEIDDSFWRNVAMDYDLYAGLFAGNSYITSINISDYITNIPSSFFSNCRGLTSITIPDSVTTIGDDAFRSCSNLTSITIPNSVTIIGWHAFKGCSSLISITIPESVTEIGWYAFADCSNLTSVNIPDSVTTIGDYAFRSCSSLTSVYCKATTPPALGNVNVFDNNGSGRKIYVPTESVDAYKSATNWSEYANAIEGYEF